MRTFIIRASVPASHIHSDQGRSTVRSDPFTTIEVAKELRGDPLKQTKGQKIQGVGVHEVPRKKMSFLNCHSLLIHYSLRNDFLMRLLCVNRLRTARISKPFPSAKLAQTWLWSQLGPLLQD